MTISSEKKALLQSRLRLAQSILEDSDLLPGADLSNDGHHERHEREALVVYLLLTCFDMLGQEKQHITFENWLRSKKAQHRGEVARALAAVTPEENKDPVSVTKSLLESHTGLYGASNAFRSGVDFLGEDAQDWLFSSISLGILPPEAKEFTNVSYPAKPIEDSTVERMLKVRYLYKRRNEFTHSLIQRQFSSSPEMAMLAKQFMDPRSEDSGAIACWLAYVRAGNVVRCGASHQDRRESEYGLLSYTVNDWPFVLFEVLYSAIGEQFSRSSINLKFVILDSSRSGETGKMQVVPSVHFSDLPATLNALGARMASWP